MKRGLIFGDERIKIARNCVKNKGGAMMRESKMKKSSRRRFRHSMAALFLCAAMSVSVLPVSAAQRQDLKNTNILLIGTDHRDDSWNGNSDTMILATIRHDEQEIMMTSFMRDLYADIPGHGVHKLNYAYAVGGADKLKETLEDNYDLSIDHYAVVDFESMADIVDIVGGVEITVSDAEAEVLNGYLNSMEAQEDYLSCGGTYVMNGNQAVAYARIRYVGNNDYQRTQRQRDILKEIFAKVQDLDGEQLIALAEEVVSDVENDYNPLEMLSLLQQLPEMKDYDLEEERIPYDGMFYSQNEMLVPDFESTIEKLHEAIGVQ